MRLLAILMLSAMAIEGWAFKTPLEEPATPSRLASSILLQGIAKAGQRLVAVGIRGTIVVSDDAGKSWRQVPVPVSADLVAVSFPNPKSGWAVGHWGVVLHTSDGGNTWVKQLDGKQANELAIRFYEGQQGKDAEATLGKLKSQVSGNLSAAFLDVYFESDKVGYVIGTFNRIFKTEDGGKTWMPWIDRIDNPYEYHLVSIRGAPGRLFITGERGLVWSLDPVGQRFVPRQTPYEGTLFGSVIDQDNIIVFGMRGNVFHSADEGKTWQQVAVTSESGSRLEAGISGGTVMPDGRIVLVSQVGNILTSNDHGKTFSIVKVPNAKPYAGIAVISDKAVALVGPKGVSMEQLP